MITPICKCAFNNLRMVCGISLSANYYSVLSHSSSFSRTTRADITRRAEYTHTNSPHSSRIVRGVTKHGVLPDLRPCEYNLCSEQRTLYNPYTYVPSVSVSVTRTAPDTAAAAAPVLSGEVAPDSFFFPHATACRHRRRRHLRHRQRRHHQRRVLLCMHASVCVCVFGSSYARSVGCRCFASHIMWARSAPVITIYTFTHAHAQTWQANKQASIQPQHARNT